MNENSDQAKNRDRRSLVERAAEKMVVDRAGKAPASAKPSPQAAQPAEVDARIEEAASEPLSTPEPAAADTADAVLARDTADMPAQVAEALSDDRSPGAVAAPAAPKPQEQKSRVVTIDVPRLMARNILTPETKRNRTLEEFRLIKRMVLSRRWDEGENPGNTIIVTSSLPSEGKTTTAINLAMSIAAEEDLRVVLVDADFIKPDALRQLGVRSEKGLIDVIQDPRMDISDVMLRTNIEKLTLIPSGRLHERCTELLASARMNDIVTELANRYDDRILIFDSPPLLATTESVVLASHMGQVVFVVQAGRTNRESVQSALELIDEGPHIGLVLNRTTSQFGKVGFGAYYDSYYYGYGKKSQARD
jgi:receptor protein-tyrosine kinase